MSFSEVARPDQQVGLVRGNLRSHTEPQSRKSFLWTLDHEWVEPAWALWDFVSEVLHASVRVNTDATKGRTKQKRPSSEEQSLEEIDFA